jgi:hypothetical protein
MTNIDELVKETIPIYTKTNPHPVRMRADCRLERDYKEMIRRLMTTELKAGVNEGQVVAKYKAKVAIL